jgi:hypothetical protein
MNASLYRRRPGKLTPLVERQLCETEDEWQSVQAADSASGQTAASHRAGWVRRGLVLCALVLLVSVLVVGHWVWRVGNAGLATVEGGLQAAVEAPLWAAAHGDVSLAAQTTADADVEWRQQVAREAQTLQPAPSDELSGAWADAVPNAQLQLVKLDGDRAVAQVQLPVDGVRYRPTRVYQQTQEGWLRTEPDAALWGAMERLETTYFVFDYHALDKAAVHEAAARLNALYPAFYGRFFAGPPRTDQAGKLALRIDPTHAPGAPTGSGRLTDPFVIPSPVLALAPAEISEAELLVQSAALVILNELTVQAAQQYTPGLRWRPLLDGLHLWQLWTLALPAAAWQEPVASWAAGDPQRAGQYLVISPGFVHEICAMHALAQPVAPVDQENRCTGAWRYRYAPHLRLDQLAATAPPDSAPGLQSVAGELGRAPHPAAIVVLGTVVEYAAATYGEATLPILLATLRDHERWETLVPAVFGVSVAEFEAGWRDYVIDHFGVAQGNARALR